MGAVSFAGGATAVGVGWGVLLGLGGGERVVCGCRCCISVMGPAIGASLVCALLKIGSKRGVVLVLMEVIMAIHMAPFAGGTTRRKPSLSGVLLRS